MSSSSSSTSTSTAPVATPGSSSNTFVLPTGSKKAECDDYIKPFLHTPEQLKILEKPSSDIEIRGNSAHLDKVQNRDSYKNAFLIQSRGENQDTPCEACAKRGPEKNNPFAKCIRLAGAWDGCCGNCKWRDHGARCSLAEFLQEEE